MCHADDTPRYSGMGQPTGFSGLGQVRMCRDWTQLRRWGREHSACWRYNDGDDAEDQDTLERYRFCPEGSPYREAVEAVFGEGLVG